MPVSRQVIWRLDRGLRACASILLLSGSASTLAQPVPAAATSFQASLGLSEAWLQRQPDGASTVASATESVTAVTPGVRWVGRTGRVQGAVDYGLSGVLTQRDATVASWQNRLQANLQASVLPGRFEVGLTGRIERQAQSALGLQAADGATGLTSNQSEVRSVGMAPRWQGQLGDVAVLQLQAQSGRTSVSGGAGSTQHAQSLSLGSPSSGSVLGWGLRASNESSGFDGGASNRSRRIVASGLVRPHYDWQAQLNVGREDSDFAAAAVRRSVTRGAGLAWTPSPRTRAAFDVESRPFGTTHQIGLEQRWSRTALRYGNGRSLVNAVSSGGRGGVSAYELFDQLLRSQEADPVARDALVRSTLARDGIDPNALVGGGFVTSAATLQRRQDLSLAWQGQREALALSAFLTTTERLTGASGAVDDLSQGRLRQRGFSLSGAHQFTPTQSVSVALSTVRSNSESGAASSLYSVSGAWSTRLGLRSSLSLGLRRSDAHTQIDSYREHAATATYITGF